MRRLLVVDDDRFQIEMLESILKGLDVEIVMAHDAKSAFEIFKQNPCHTVISDLNMPGSSGLELLENIRSAGFDVPFIILTGWGSQAQATRALRLGATDMLEKPVDYREIIKAVDKALQIGYRTEKIREISRGNIFGKKEIHRIEHEQKMIAVYRAFNKED